MVQRAWMIILAGLAVAPTVFAADYGFYGGLDVRASPPAATLPLDLGSLPSAWTKLTPGIKDEASGGTLLYGGYRFSELPSLGVEAAISNTADQSGVGLRLDPRALGGRAPDSEPRNWNVDLFTNLAVNGNLGVYGRMGYEYSDLVRSASSGLYSPATQDSVLRRYRDGFNYGVGMRYDLNRSLGLRLELSRFARLGSDPTVLSPPQDSDLLSIGVQYRF